MLQERARNQFIMSLMQNICVFPPYSHHIYIDRVIACSSSVSEKEEKYLKLQRHKHSKTCKKKVRNQKLCRFGAPWPPMSHTAVLHPLDGEQIQNVNEYKLVNGEIQALLNKLKPDGMDMTLGEFLQKLHITEDLYI